MLIIFGQSDIYGRTTERLVARYPNARVVTISDAGHIPWIQNRPAFVAAVVSFFRMERAAYHGMQPTAPGAIMRCLPEA